MNTDPQKHTTVPADQAAKQERTVTVQVLTIGKKQVTQTLYRQLVEENVIDDSTGKLKGEVWGWVNVHASECGSVEHMHVIWEQGGQLKRANSYATVQSSDVHAGRLEMFEDLAKVYVSYVALSGQVFPNWELRQRDIFFTVKGRALNVHISLDIHQVWGEAQWIKQFEEEEQSYLDVTTALYTAEERERDVADVQKRIQQSRTRQQEYAKEIEQSIERILSHLPEELRLKCHSKDETYAALKAMADDLDTFERTWKESYQAIKDAGQLFIAVSGVWK